MKIQVIGDIHGRRKWENLVDTTCDQIIFLGDYVDAYDLDNENIIENLLNIIDFKRKNEDKVILILGNHDIQYMYIPDYRCSGFRPEIANDIQDIFNNNRRLFKIAHQIDMNLFTHGGVTKQWVKWAKDKLDYYGLNADLTNIAETLNNMNETANRWILHNVGELRGGLRYDYGGPTWADKKETGFGAIPGIAKFVGHTPVADIHDNGVGDNEIGKVTYCDVLARLDATLIMQ